ncbi:MAG TPA: hypothetical protein VL171_17475 [Verrucomicrobiae bacterium]|nr:hypothetical protein [Verrucomicrobiae bacterium]
MTGYCHRFPRYGTIGLAVLLLMETAILCGRSLTLSRLPWGQITSWATPVCWWAYILVCDAWIYRRKGTSLLMDRRRLLMLECILSVAFWCLFEAYNRTMPGWRYQNLEANLSLRMLGYAVSFATIMPGLFLTCELLQSYGLFARARIPPVRWNPSALNISIALGAIFCLAPPFFPSHVRGYLWAFVWLGWFFLLEPFNYRRGAQSIYRDWERGRLARTLQLFAAGAICGLLWEFWNMWAYTRWIYVFPLGQSLKCFEMPLVGFLGFLPFALEYFVMFHFLASFFTREDQPGI